MLKLPFWSEIQWWLGYKSKVRCSLAKRTLEPTLTYKYIEKPCKVLILSDDSPLPIDFNIPHQQLIGSGAMDYNRLIIKIIKSDLIQCHSLILLLSIEMRGRLMNRQLCWDHIIDVLFLWLLVSVLDV